MRKLLSKKGPLADIKTLPDDFTTLQADLAGITDTIKSALTNQLDKIAGIDRIPLTERFIYGKVPSD